MLENVVKWVKFGGVLVYVICIIYFLENEGVIEKFLINNYEWEIEVLIVDFMVLSCREGWIKIWFYRE